jgi:hypothetical protein
MFPLESLFCPCCTPAVLHALSQSGFLLLGAGSLSAAVGLSKSSLTTSDTGSDNPAVDRA